MSQAELSAGVASGEAMLCRLGLARTALGGCLKYVCRAWEGCNFTLACLGCWAGQCGELSSYGWLRVCVWHQGMGGQFLPYLQARHIICHTDLPS